MKSAQDTNAELLRYTNQCGQTYHLRLVKLTSGCRYAMTKSAAGEVVSLPAGF